MYLNFPDKYQAYSTKRDNELELLVLSYLKEKGMPDIVKELQEKHHLNGGWINTFLDSIQFFFNTGRRFVL